MHLGAELPAQNCPFPGLLPNTSGARKNCFLMDLVEVKLYNTLHQERWQSHFNSHWFSWQSRMTMVIGRARRKRHDREGKTAPWIHMLTWKNLKWVCSHSLGHYCTYLWSVAIRFEPSSPYILAFPAFMSLRSVGCSILVRLCSCIVAVHWLFPLCT